MAQLVARGHSENSWTPRSVRPVEAEKILVSGCGAVGSARRSGRRGRPFKSDHPDQNEITGFILLFYFVLSECKIERTKSGRVANQGSENLFSTLDE